MADKVKPLKLENPATGGTESDLFPTEVDPAEDYLSCKGIAFDASDSNLLFVSSSVLTSSLNFSAPLLISSSLTTGRVVYTTTSGQLTNNSKFTYSGSTLGLDGDMDIIDTGGQTILTVGSGTASSANTININGASGGYRRITFQTASVNRWQIGASEHTEAGGDTGTAFRVSAYTDAGGFIDNTIFITRPATDAPRIQLLGQTRVSTSQAVVLRLLSTSGSSSRIRLDNNSTSAYTDLYESGGVQAVWQHVSSGDSLIDITPVPLAAGNYAITRFGRLTNNTASATGVQILDHTSSANVTHEFRVKSGTTTVLNEQGIDIDFRVEGDTNTHLLFLDASTDKIGINSSAIPHGGIGWAKIAIDGTNASSSGPHIQFTTASDDYPLLQMLNYAHDNVTLLFDSYYDGSVFRSGSTAPSFLVRKYNNFFRIMGAPATTQGADLTSSLIDMVQIRGTGEVSLDRGFDMSYNSLISEDFICNLVSGGYNWTTISAGMGAVDTNSSRVDQNHYGVVRLHVEDDIDPDVAGLHLGGYTMRLSGGAVFIETCVHVETLGTSHHDFEFFIGLGDSTGGPSSCTDAVGFYYDRLTNSGNWTLRTRSAGTTTDTNTSSAVAAATWVRLGFLVNAGGTSVTPYINGTAGTAATTNIPIGSSALVGPLMTAEKTNGTGTSRNVYVDYYKMAVRFTNQR